MNLSGQKGVFSIHYIRADPPLCPDKFIWSDAISLEQRKYVYFENMVTGKLKKGIQLLCLGSVALPY